MRRPPVALAPRPLVVLAPRLRPLVVLAVVLAGPLARAQYNPATRTPSGQPIAPGATATAAPPAGIPPGGYATARPATTAAGGYVAPSPYGTSGQGATEQRLVRSEREDSGRGLEWFYVGAEGGVRWVGTDTISSRGGALLTGGKKQGGVGPGAGVFVGARFYVLTVGARVRTAWLPDSQYLSAGGEVGLHIPMGDLEPHAWLGGGYATLLGVDEKVRGFDVNLGLGLDYYVSNNVSLGALTSIELLRLSRDSFHGQPSGSATGLSVTGSGVVGLHFLAMLPALGALVLSVALSASLVRWLWNRHPALGRRTLVVAAVAGALGALFTLGATRWMVAVLGRAPGDAPPWYATLGFVGPLGQGLALLAVWPLFRRGLLRGPLEGVTTAAVVGLAAGGVEAVSLLMSGSSGHTWRTAAWPLAGALLLSVPVATLRSTPWALVVGRSYGRTYPRAGFLPAWMAAAGLHGVVQHLLAQRTPLALGVVATIGASLGVLLVMARRTLRVAPEDAPRRRAPVAAGERRRVDMATLLAPRDTPVSLRWVALGVMVNQGTLVASLAAAVLVGHYFRIDFGAIDTATSSAAGPLLLLGSAVLGAFPVAGWLVVRASGVPTLLEPALASLLALVGLAVVLGVAAPVGLLVLLATAPVALVLSCAGGWLALR